MARNETAQRISIADAPVRVLLLKQRLTTSIFLSTFSVKSEIDDPGRLIGLKRQEDSPIGELANSQ